MWVMGWYDLLVEFKHLIPKSTGIGLNYVTRVRSKWYKALCVTTVTSLLSFRPSAFAVQRWLPTRIGLSIRVQSMKAPLPQSSKSTSLDVKGGGVETWFLFHVGSGGIVRVSFQISHRFLLKTNSHLEGPPPPPSAHSHPSIILASLTLARA